MRKEIIFYAVAFVGGAAIGYLFGKKRTERQYEETEPKIIRLYPEEPEEDVNEELPPTEDEEIEDREIAEDIARENGYVVETEDEQVEREAIESSEAYKQFVEQNSQLISVISPYYEKREDEINNALDFVENEQLLYFPDEDILCTESGTRLDEAEVAGNCLTKYNFKRDDYQKEVEILNIPMETHYIVRKETEDTYDELFPDE